MLISFKSNIYGFVATHQKTQQGLKLWDTLKAAGGVVATHQKTQQGLKPLKETATDANIPVATHQKTQQGLKLDRYTLQQGCWKAVATHQKTQQGLKQT